MIRYNIIYLTFLLIGCQALVAQEVKSGKSSLRINNIPRIEQIEVPDTEPPDIEIISPKIYLGTRFYTDQQELDIIGKVIDSSGISAVMVNGEIKTPTESGIFTIRLSLEPGDNRVRIMALDKKENLKDAFFLVDYRPPVVSLADKIYSSATYYGLIIGIENYQDEQISDLTNPVNDAKLLMQTLTELYTFHEENIRFIPNATRADIIRSLDQLSDVVSSNDNLLIYYAGHGWWDPDANNGYWLPADADESEKTNWFRNSTLVDYLKEIKSKHTLLISDACFGGSIFSMRNAFGNQDKAFEKLYELPSRKAMTSGDLTMVPDRSSFSRYLLQRLRENDETYLSSEQLFSSFRLAVINNSEAIPRYGEIENVGDEGGDFIFLKK